MKRTGTYRFTLPMILVLISFDLFAQGSGLFLDNEAYDKMPTGGLEKAKDHIVPAEYSLKAYTPLPRSQGNIASCIGWAIGYGAMSIERSISKGITDRMHITDQLAHSALYIYQHVKRGDGCQALASIPDALEFINRQGDCLEATFPTSTTHCHTSLSDQIDREARRFRISTPGYKVFSLDATGREKIRAVKAHLAAGHPIVAGISETPPYRPLLGKSVWPIEPSKQGGHAMVVVGYSDPTRHFELMNSFGTAWGEQGFIHISYEDFSMYCKQAFVLNNTKGTKGLLSQPVTHQVPLTTQVKVKTWSALTHNFQSMAFRYQGNYFKPQDTIKTLDPIELFIEVEKGRCAYLINVDIEGKARLAWSMEYPSQDTLVKIPEKGWWEFSSSGQEIFCLLYGYQFISNPSELIRMINLHPGPDAHHKVKNAAQVRSCDMEKIIFSPDQISAQAALLSGYERFIPIFFALQIK